MAVEIELDEKTRYKLYGDKYSVTLDKAYWSKTKKAWLYGPNKTFHSNLGEEVRSMMKKEARCAVGDEKTVTSIQEINAKVDAFMERITTMFEALPEEILGKIPRKFYLDEDPSET